MRVVGIQQLYLRVWLAIVAAVLLVSLLFAWLWRLEAEHERGQRHDRAIVIYDAQGAVLGRSSEPPRPSGGAPGLEFVVKSPSGETMLVRLARPGRPPAWWRPPFDLVWLLALVAAAVALGAYPVVRRLTKRLEALQTGVERWGEGDLSRRLPVDGRDEVAFLASRFNSAAARIEAMLHAHKTLLANASHELRSPLARIRMGLELMGEHPSAALRDEMARNIRELDLLIDEILLASRLDANPQAIGSFERVDLLGLCAEECAQTGASLEAPDPDTDLAVVGVERLLRRCVRNLLENARRYTSGAVSVSLQRQSDFIVLRVNDEGPGIAPSAREHIFEPFYRLPGSSERDGGVGLGLSLVKTIAERHGGKVWCEDRAGSGTCFVVTLPAAPSPTA